MNAKEIQIGDTLGYLDYSAPCLDRDRGTIYERDPRFVRCTVVRKFRNKITVITEYGRELTDRAQDFSHKLASK